MACAACACAYIHNLGSTVRSVPSCGDYDGCMNRYHEVSDTITEVICNLANDNFLGKINVIFREI